jgi:predicted nucleic-acid-binding protein
MKVTVDTNVLLRTIVADDPEQAELAQRLFAEADVIVVGLQTLAELVWVLRGSYGVARDDLVTAIRTISQTEKIVLDRLGVEAGLACLEAGGDFADGVVAWEGAQRGGEVFVSFDKKAVATLTRLGRAARLLIHPDDRQ